MPIECLVCPCHKLRIRDFISYISKILAEAFTKVNYIRKICCISRQFCLYLYCKLKTHTTDTLRLVQVGSSSVSHKFSSSLQADISICIRLTSVAVFTPERVLAQAIELTSHRPEKITVTRQSCGEFNMWNASRNTGSNCANWSLS